VNGLKNILPWLEANVESMRQSRRKTLAAIVEAAMSMQGTGVLALGRAMPGATAAKHCIKRVDRFLGNAQVEVDAVFESLFRACCPAQGEVVVLADWTDRRWCQQLVLALSRNGRALPFLCITVPKGEAAGEQKGAMIAAEAKALELLEQFCPAGRKPIVIADRGFGNSRWLEEVQKRGWHFVQRMACNHYVEVEEHIGSLAELGIRKSSLPKSWGWGTLGEKHWGKVRLVTARDKKAAEPWLLLTNMDHLTSKEVCDLYAKRFWIEEMFRDLKNRELGLGMDRVCLSTVERFDRHFLVIALAYVFLCAFGAVAEVARFADQLKANTVKRRVLSLAKIGAYCVGLITCTLDQAMLQLSRIPT
jgi:hypothetical protein